MLRVCDTKLYLSSAQIIPRTPALTATADSFQLAADRSPLGSPEPLTAAVVARRWAHLNR